MAVGCDCEYGCESGDSLVCLACCETVCRVREREAVIPFGITNGSWLNFKKKWKPVVEPETLGNETHGKTELK